MSLEKCRRICPECGYGMCLSPEHSMLPCACGHTRLDHLKYAYRTGFGAPTLSHPHPCNKEECPCPTYVSPSVDELLADMQELNDELDDLEMPEAA